MNNQNHVLIYSRYCEYCNELIEKLKDTPSIAKTIEAHEIDKLKNVPVWVKKVPAIMTNTGEKLQGTPVFRWL
ncbi:uncharacterized protein METZ01_LOCUS401282, partial [marine metagenome]